MKRMKAAAVQMTSGNVKGENLRRAGELLLEGIEAGARLLALPENFSFMGTEGEKPAAAETLEGGESVAFLKDFAARHKVWLVGGSVPLRADDGRVTNTSLLIDDKGGIAARYDKIHLFDVDLKGGESHRESAHVQPGDRVVTAQTPFCRVGLSVCYDLRFPELYRQMGREGAVILFSPAAFTVQTGMAHWELLIRARAVENQLYMVAPAQFGSHPGDRRTYGSAMIVDPWGTVLARAPERACVVTAEIDLDYLAEVRRRLPALGHVRLKG